jgi:hypothetical protein
MATLKLSTTFADQPVFRRLPKPRERTGIALKVDQPAMQGSWQTGVGRCSSREYRTEVAVLLR